MMNFFSKKSHFWALSLFVLGLMFFATNSVSAQTSTTVTSKVQSNATYLPQLQSLLNSAVNSPVKSATEDYNRLKVAYLNRVIAGVEVANAPHFSRVMRAVVREMKNEFPSNQVQIDAIYSEVKSSLGI